MNVFTKSLSRRAVALLLTIFAFGITAKAQISPFMNILEDYNLKVEIKSQTPPYGQQLENYDFESWENEGEASVEPTQWNSFMNAETSSSFLNSAKSQQLNYSTEKRPNSSGSRSARIYSREINVVFTKIVANGNLTNGRIYAGSATANNDGNYNYTVRSNADYNTSLTTIPDSLTVWVAFKPKDASKGNAKITTTIHGDTDLKQLAKSGNSPVELVCATADAEIAATSTSAVVWKRVTIPFTKGSNNDPRYILVTFNTNVTPGGGSANDELYVDDICLIYNPTLNMELLAQTEYQYSGNGVTMNINVPFALDGSMSVYNMNKADNEVIAQLSDANGSFANPIELGRMTTNVSGTISGVIPADLPAGTGYKVRVVSTNYPLESENNPNITISYYVPVPQVEIALGEVATKSAAATFTPNEDCANYYFMISNEYGLSADAVKANGTLKSGTYTHTWNNLTSNTNYMIYVLPVDENDKEGELVTMAVKTNAFEPRVNITIAQNNVTAKSITATFAPNADCVEYYFMLSTESGLTAEKVQAEGTKQTAEYTNTWENLTSNTAYTAYALPFDVDGNAGAMKTSVVTTKALVPQVEIALGAVSTKSIEATFTPNADCVEYYFMITTESEVAAETVMAEGVKQTDVCTYAWESLVSNTEYKIIALPIDMEGNAGELKVVAVKTESYSPQVEIERGNFTAKTIAATFTPNADCVEYYFMITTESEVTAETVKAEGTKHTGVYTHTWENLTSNTTYTVYALPFDVDGNAGELKSVAITTKKLVAQVEIATTEVATYSISASFTPNADCAEYYFMISTETGLTAETVKENGELKTESSAKTWVDLTSSTNYTIYALPVDIEGNLGTLNTLVVKTKVEAGVSEVEINIKKISYTSVEITATPNENTVSYRYIVMEKAEADAMGEDALMQKLNEENNLTAEEMFTMDVESNVEYYIIAQGKNADGKSGEVTKLVFMVDGPSTVAIEVEKLSETTVSVTATPNDNTVSYHYIVIEKTEADAMDEDALMQKLAESNELDAVDVWTWTIKPNTEYYVIAQGKNADGRFGEIAKIEFTVAGKSVVAIVVEEMSDTSVAITSTPNENTVSYHYIVIEKAEADAMGEDALMQKLGEDENYLETADTKELTIESNVRYYVVAQGKNADGKWGEVTKVEFVVEVAGPAVVEIAVEELSTTSVAVLATPNENTVQYHYIVIEKAEADAMGEDALMQKLGEDENYLKGENRWEWEIKPDTYYYVVAQGKNADEVWGEVTKVEFMVKQPAGTSVVEIDFELVSSTSVEVTATPNENTVSYKYIVISKAEAEAIGEDATMQKLYDDENTLEGVDVSEWTIEANVKYYIIAQGKNADDVLGDVTKLEFIVLYDDIAELENVTVNIYPNPASEYVRINADFNIDELVIYSIDGKMVYAESVNQQETMIDVAEFAKGSYIVRMISNGKAVVRNILVK